jgi:hypothetical protein
VPQLVSKSRLLVKRLANPLILLWVLLLDHCCKQFRFNQRHFRLSNKSLLLLGRLLEALSRNLFLFRQRRFRRRRRQRLPLVLQLAGCYKQSPFSQPLSRLKQMQPRLLVLRLVGFCLKRFRFKAQPFPHRLKQPHQFLRQSGHLLPHKRSRLRIAQSGAKRLRF